MDNIFEIYLSDRSVQDIELAKKLSPSLAKDLQRIASNAITEISDMALFAAQSKSPIDTGELRESFIVRSTPSRTAKQPQATVYILSGTHLGRDRKPIDSSKLADILNIGVGKGGRDLHRSRDSAGVGIKDTKVNFGSEPKGSPTRDWVGKAERSLKLRLNQYIIQRSFNY